MTPSVGNLIAPFVSRSQTNDHKPAVSQKISPELYMYRKGFAERVRANLTDFFEITDCKFVNVLIQLCEFIHFLARC